MMQFFSFTIIIIGFVKVLFRMAVVFRWQNFSLEPITRGYRRREWEEVWLKHVVAIETSVEEIIKRVTDRP